MTFREKLAVIVCVLIGVLVLFYILPKDEVYVDDKHDVICVVRDEYVLGCMTPDGKEMPDEHIKHVGGKL